MQIIVLNNCMEISKNTYDLQPWWDYKVKINLQNKIYSKTNTILININFFFLTLTFMWEMMFFAKMKLFHRMPVVWPQEHGFFYLQHVCSLPTKWCLSFSASLSSRKISLCSVLIRLSSWMHHVQVKSVYILAILLETCLMLVLVKILALPLKSCITFEVSFSDFRFLTCKVMIKKK